MRMVILETSGARGLLVLARGRDVRFVADGGERGHLAEWLLPALSEAMERLGWTRQDLDMVAVGVGPGSFTGLRVGLATAKGLAVGLGTPLVALGSLEALASAVPSPGPIVVVSAVGRAMVDGALFCSGGGSVERLHGPIGGAVASVAAELAKVAGGEPVHILGEGARRHRGVFEQVFPGARWLTPDWDVPRAEVLARMAFEAGEQQAFQDPLTLEPRYVRGVGAVPPKRALGVPRAARRR